MAENLLMSISQDERERAIFAAAESSRPTYNPIWLPLRTEGNAEAGRQTGQRGYFLRSKA